MLGGGVVYHDTLHVWHPQRTETQTEHIIVNESYIHRGEMVGARQRTLAKIKLMVIRGLEFTRVFFLLLLLQIWHVQDMTEAHGANTHKKTSKQGPDHVDEKQSAWVLPAGNTSS